MVEGLLNSEDIVIRTDEITLDDTYLTPEGFLVDKPIVTTCGVFNYKNPDGSIRRELRLPEEVFAPESLQSYKGKPFIITHGPGAITKDNVKEESIGAILTSGLPEGKNVRVEVVIHDVNKLRQVSYRQLSLGYATKLDWTPGVFNGQPYDAIQRRIRVNHLALVRAARAGEEARLNVDSKDEEGGEENNMAKNLIDSWREKRAVRSKELQARLDAEDAEKKVEKEEKKEDAAAATETPAKEEKKEDGVNTPAKEEEKKEDKADVEDCSKAVRDNLDRRDSSAEPTNMDEALSMIADQDRDIEKLLKVTDSLNAKLDFFSTRKDEKDPENNKKEDVKVDKKDEQQELRMDAAEIERIVNEKIQVLRIGDRLNLDGLEALPILEAKKKVIGKVNPNMRLDGKSNDYINAAFEVAADSASGINLQRRQMFQETSKMNLDEKDECSADATRSKMLEGYLGTDVRK